MILTVLAVILGTLLFLLVNSIMDITYFGCGAIGSMWVGCFVAAYAIIGSLGGLVLGLLKWITIGAIILFVIGLSRK